MSLPSWRPNSRMRSGADSGPVSISRKHAAHDVLQTYCTWNTSCNLVLEQVSMSGTREEWPNRLSRVEWVKGRESGCAFAGWSCGKQRCWEAPPLWQSLGPGSRVIICPGCCNQFPSHGNHTHISTMVPYFDCVFCSMLDCCFHSIHLYCCCIAVVVVLVLVHSANDLQ